MIPVCDVIPKRTSPIVTTALVAVWAVALPFLPLGPIGPAVISVICLWLFGWTVEDRLGHVRFAAVFAACGLVAGLTGGGDEGMAGGVAGTLAGYFVLYPRALMLVLVPAPGLLVEIPAVIIFALWSLLQILVGPFLPQLAAAAAGAALAFLLKRPERMRVEWWSPKRT